MLRYFRWAWLVAAVGLILAGWVGWETVGGVRGILAALWITAVLAILEASLSFDNAVVNAAILKRMAPVWRRRFLFWGMIIAVFGMRLLFPVIIVAVAAWISPWEAFELAVTQPRRYGEIIGSSHIAIAGFGGTFLAMVAFSYFLRPNKTLHWIAPLERPLAALGHVPGVGIALTLLGLYATSLMVGHEETATFLSAGILGILVHSMVIAVRYLLGTRGQDKAEGDAASGSASGMLSFLYLELLDASFSFDGVIGGFALTNDIFLLAIGLGIGAMFVRSMTVMLVDRETLGQYRYLENGAFWAIMALAAIMMLSVWIDIPEAVTGLIGAGLIGLALWSSIRARPIKRSTGGEHAVEKAIKRRLRRRS